MTPPDEKRRPAGGRRFHGSAGGRDHFEVYRHRQSPAAAWLEYDEALVQASLRRDFGWLDRDFTAYEKCVSRKRDHHPCRRCQKKAGGDPK